jgi:hypothetical protein
MNKLWKTMGKAPQIKAFAGVHNWGGQAADTGGKKGRFF